MRKLRTARTARWIAESEISGRELGALVMSELKKLDQVAYVRFASVYRDFRDVDDFAQEIRALKGHKE